MYILVQQHQLEISDELYTKKRFFFRLSVSQILHYKKIIFQFTDMSLFSFCIKKYNNNCIIKGFL